MSADRPHIVPLLTLLEFFLLYGFQNHSFYVQCFLLNAHLIKNLTLTLG